MVVTVALRATGAGVRCLTVNPEVLHQGSDTGRRSPTAARNINGDDSQLVPQGPAPHPERHWIAQGYCHFQEVADAGIRVPILFLTWDTRALGLLKVSGEDSVIPALGVSFSHSSTMSYSLLHRQESVLGSPQQNYCLQLSHPGHSD